ncbi:MAG: hypothetical protein ACYDIC_17345 [Desulfobaccales bacterium]
MLTPALIRNLIPDPKTFYIQKISQFSMAFLTHSLGLSNKNNCTIGLIPETLDKVDPQSRKWPETADACHEPQNLGEIKVKKSIHDLSACSRVQQTSVPRGLGGVNYAEATANTKMRSNE